MHRVPTQTSRFVRCAAVFSALGALALGVNGFAQSTAVPSFEQTFDQAPEVETQQAFCSAPKGKLEFEFNDSVFSMKKAYWLSWAAIQAYMPQWKPELQKFGLTEVDYFSNPTTGLRGYVASNENVVIVAYSGTIDPTDVLYDLRFNLKSDAAHGVKGLVHAGFLSSIDPSWEHISQKIAEHRKGQKPVFVTGHSLGAALATLTAMRLELAGQPVSGAFLFASPRVGNEEFAQHFNSVLKEKAIQFVNNEDVVSRIPAPTAAAVEFSWLFLGPLRDWVKDTFTELKYAHVGVRYLFDAQGALRGPVPVNDEEDKRFWQHIFDRTSKYNPLDWIAKNWRVILDHNPFPNFCNVANPPVNSPEDIINLPVHEGH